MRTKCNGDAQIAHDWDSDCLVAFKMAIVVGDCCLQVTKRDVHVTHEFTGQDLVYPTSLHFSPRLSLPVVFESVTSYIALWTFLNQLGIVVIAGKGRQRP